MLLTSYAEFCASVISKIVTGMRRTIFAHPELEGKADTAGLARGFLITSGHFCRARGNSGICGAK